MEEDTAMCFMCFRGGSGIAREGAQISPWGLHESLATKEHKLDVHNSGHSVVFFPPHSMESPPPAVISRIYSSTPKFGKCILNSLMISPKWSSF